MESGIKMDKNHLEEDKGCEHSSVVLGSNGKLYCSQWLWKIKTRYL